MKIAIVGPRLFGGRAGQALRDRGHEVTTWFHEELWAWTLPEAVRKLAGADVVYAMYGSAIRSPALAAALRLRATRIVVHFIGSDVLELAATSGLARHRWLLALRLSHRVLAVSPALADRLSSHVAARTLPLNFRSVDCELAPFPDTPAVLAYLPESRAEFYGRSLVARLVEDHPRVDFIVLGKHPELQRPNVEQLEIDFHRDMESIYRRTTVLVRLTEHDGLSNMVMESLARGRRVIWTQSLPYCETVPRDYPQVRAALARALAAEPDRRAMRWVRERFDHDRIMDDVERVLRGHPVPVRTPDAAGSLVGRRVG